MLKLKYSKKKEGVLLENNFQFYLPTRIIQGPDCLIDHSSYMKRLGKKALIVTGINSSKLNGSLDDVITALEKENIRYKIFDQIDDNPTIDIIQQAFDENEREGISFIIGLGKGSPIDAAKAIGVLFRNRGISGREAFNMKNLRSIPIVAVPTTAGTGSEVTPYSIIADQNLRTKKDFGQESFPKLAYLDPRYIYAADFTSLLHNAFDAFSHLVEGYLNNKATVITDVIAEKGLAMFASLHQAFLDQYLTPDQMDQLLMASAMGGMVISQTGTSLPHALGYVLTYEKGIPHGFATAAIYKGYLTHYKDSDKLNRMLNILNFDSTEKMMDYIDQIVDYNLELNDNEIREYTRNILNNQGKLKNHPERITRTQIAEMYQKAIK